MRRLLELPDDYSVLFTASATEAMEAIVRNLTEESSFHLVVGSFSRRFQDVSATLGREAEMAEAPEGQGLDPAGVEPTAAELLCVTHVETSTGVEADLAGLADWRRRRPDASIAVDVVASAPTRRMAWADADAWFFSVQKAWGLPAGLGVMLISPRALERAQVLDESGGDVGYLRRFATLAENARESQTLETPNVLAIHLLGRVAQRLLDAGGIAALESSTDAKAAALYGWLDAHPRLRAFVRDPKHRSRTVIVVELPPGVDAAALRRNLAAQGLTLGAGYGRFKATQVRIANWPAHSAGDHRAVMQALDALAGGR